MNDNSTQVKGISWPEGIDALIVSKPTNRRYLSGFTGSSGILLLTASGAKVLITDFRYIEQAQAQSPTFQIFPQSLEITQTIKEFIDAYDLKKIGVEKDYVTVGTFKEYCDKIPDINFIPIINPCEGLRQVKSAQELELIKKAIDIADKTFLHIKSIIELGMTEKEIAMEIDFSMRRLGSERNAFETIVASGIRSSLPHGTPSDKAICSGDFVTMDFGAVFGGYCSDITRTLIMERLDPPQEKLYNLVKQAQETAIKSIQPGMIAADVDKVARDIIARAGYGDAFGHGLGHGVGLDIHEEPRFSPRDKTILEPGMVITVEPGIYLQGWGGLRIEDMIVVTAKGCEVLTKSPKNIQDMTITH